MKTALLIFCAIIGVLANLKEEKEKLHKIHEECQADPSSCADDELLKHLSKNLHNPQVQAHMLCESTKICLQDKNGKLNIEKIKEKVALCVADKKKVDCLVKKCAIEKKTPGETAVHLFMCLDNHNVTYFHEFDG